MRLLNRLDDLRQGSVFDVVVVGAGGAGMAAALFAALQGREVLLVERTPFVGGTTALSAGTCWVPGTRQGAAANPADTLEQAAHYLDNAIGDRTPAPLRQAFLDHGAQAIDLLEQRTEVRFRPYARHPDYLSELGGSTVAGRALEPLPFDGRLLGPLFALVRPPIAEFTVLGGMMVDRTDINHLLGMGRSLASLKHALRIVARHGRDRLGHPRGTRLVMGNALVARLLLSLSRLPNVTLALHTGLSQLTRSATAVDGVVLQQAGQECRVAVRGGVILASGGFNRHPQRRQALLTGADMASCPGAPGHTGEAHALAEAVGAHYAGGALSPAFWAPVSRRRRADGSVAVFPHFVMDRAKPGMLAVNAAGERFVNESTSYHLFALAMQQQARPQGEEATVFLVCDAPALRRYGIGMVRPGGKGLGPFLADGYLVRADTLSGLASALGMDAARLQATVERFNGLARSGVDSDWQRGETAYQRNLGDAQWPGPNPCLGPLEQGPYYAVRLHPGDIGAAQGFATDGDARALDTQGRPIAGLYAAGNDMHSIMGGVYTAPGITIGPGIVFGHQAARHASARAAAAAG